MCNSNLFSNKRLNLEIRTIINKDGSIGMNAYDAAIGLGWFEIKGDKIYPRWRSINSALRSFGFSQEVAKDDFIPENAFYMLGMRAKNENAIRFQMWIACDVIPSIRKNGEYRIEDKTKQLTYIDSLGKTVDELEKKVYNIENNSPLFNIECDELQKYIKIIVIKELGGKNSKAYKNRSLRTKAFKDIQREIKRQFGVSSYKAIYRKDFKKAKEIISRYSLPLIFKDEVAMLNEQICLQS